MSVWFDVCKWGASELGECLNHSGYSSDDIVSAKFESLNHSRQAVFSIKFKNEETDTGLEESNVYVWLNSNGVLAASF
jgi:hypothetical protein